MRISLISPGMPYGIDERPELQFPPLGICSLAAVLEEAGHDVQLVDLAVIKWDFEWLKNKLRSFTPDIFGISALTASFPRTLLISHFLHEEFPDIPIVLGGIHPTFTDEKTLSENDEIDIIVRREGEITFLELLKAMEKGTSFKSIDGLTYREDGRIIRTPDRPFIKDLDSLPIPAYHLLDTIDIYNKVQSQLIVSSRGCPNHCIFCSTSAYWGHFWRGMSPPRVLQEMDILVHEYNATRIVFGDDLFTLNKKRVHQICDGLQERGNYVEWLCSVRADSINLELLKHMKAARCVGVFIGVESGRQESLDKMNKRTTVNDNIQAVKMCKQANLETTTSFLLGLPWETEDNIRETIDFAVNKLGSSEVIWSLLHPDVGSHIYNNLPEYGIQFVDSNLEHCMGNAPSVISTTHLSADELSELWVEAAIMLDHTEEKEKEKEKEKATKKEKEQTEGGGCHGY
ncbi:MAG: cobalamin B12-binding domain-containing protein [Theionarchaea archaeon]|nr:cobalamin B12-binding domain-containing protein [Theionarchaea archaeon]